MTQRESGTGSAEQPKRVHPGQFKPGQSGNPEGGRVKGRRFGELFASIAQDYGGPSALTGLQKVALEQACRLLVKAERAVDPKDTVRLANAGARMLSGVMRRTLDPRVNNAPKPPAPSLAEHLAKLAERKGAVAAVDDEAQS